MPHISVALAVGCALWWLLIAAVAANILQIRRISELGHVEPEPWPKVSMISAARDEAHTIEAGIASRLAQDYWDLELVMIDDRSTDSTGEIIDRAARHDPRIRPVHVKELPDGWTGKVHAMNRAWPRRRASGYCSRTPTSRWRPTPYVAQSRTRPSTTTTAWAYRRRCAPAAR